MNELTKRVEQWYGTNRERLAEHFQRTAFQDKTDWDPIRGAVNVVLWGSALVATITVWSKGDLSVDALKTGNKEPFWIEDRVLLPNEDIASLLDSCAERLLQLAQLGPQCAGRGSSNSR